MDQMYTILVFSGNSVQIEFVGGVLVFSVGWLAFVTSPQEDRVPPPLGGAGSNGNDMAMMLFVIVVRSRRGRGAKNETK